MNQYLEQITSRQDLTQQEMKEASRLMFAEETSDSEIGAFLTALKTKGETAEEVAGLVEAIREKSVALNESFPGVIDNCGTGGDRSGSFNISTTSAFVVAGAGITVAKHGNRSISSKTGSADVLEELGVSLQFTGEQMQEVLSENGIAFLFAPHVHPALKRVMKVRKELNIPTIFNVIGPLTNPVQLETQLMGVYREDMLLMLGAVLQKLGRKRALLVHGAGRMDEASLAGENKAVLVEGEDILPFTLNPEDTGLPSYDNALIKGGDAKENARIMLNVLNGKTGAHRDTVLLNAGLAIVANGKANTIQEGIEIAKESIDSGRALKKLNFLIDYSKSTKAKVAER